MDSSRVAVASAERAVVRFERLPTHAPANAPKAATTPLTTGDQSITVNLGTRWALMGQFPRAALIRSGGTQVGHPERTKAYAWGFETLSTSATPCNVRNRGRAPGASALFSVIVLLLVSEQAS